MCEQEKQLTRNTVDREEKKGLPAIPDLVLFEETMG